jgi:NAD(P)H dehydrogenase (quinone)
VILVTGATGQVGYHLMEALADARADVTAMVRVDARAAGLPGSPQHIVASFDEPPPAEFLRTCDRVFLLSPANEEQAELETIFIDALVAAGHGPHVVKLAADGFQDPDCDVRFMRSHRQVAVHLEATGLPATFLAPSMYMETLLRSADTIRDQGLIFAPAGQATVGFVAAQDVARVAAHVLTTPGHEDQTYLLTGPQALSYADVAARVSAVFAREVDYQDLAEAQAKEQMLARGLDPWRVDGLLELYDWIRHGAAGSVTSTVYELTGDDPHTIEDWLSEMRGAFVGRPQDVPPEPV